jgi:phosphoribosylanthranilate isomerase
MLGRNQHPLAFAASAVVPGSRAQALKSLKVCGVTSAEDATWILETIQRRLSVQVWIGCVLWPHSRRCVSVREARDIAAAVRETAAKLGTPARTVAVFVDEDLSRVRQVCTDASINVAQLHGSLDWQEHVLRAVDSWPSWLDYARVLRPDEAAQEPSKRAITTADGRPPCYTLIDPGRGDGKPFDWRKFSNERVLGPDPGLWMIAGGLHAGNVVEAVRVTNAPGVDVASGVEVSTDGLRKHESGEGSADAYPQHSGRVYRPRKDPARLEAFLDALCSVYGGRMI